MTKIKYREHPVWHETEHQYDGKPVLVAEQPEALLLRIKGQRQPVRLPWGVALMKAAQLEADANVVRRRHTVRRGALI